MIVTYFCPTAEWGGNPPVDLDFFDDLRPLNELAAFVHAYDEHGVFHHVNGMLTDYARLQQLHDTINNHSTK